MPAWQVTPYEVASQLSAELRTLDPNFVWNGIFAFVLGGLALVAWTKQSRLPAGNERLLVWGFLTGFVFEMFILLAKILGTLEIVDRDLLQFEIPLMEFALQSVVAVLLAAGFVCHVLNQIQVAKKFVIAGLVVIAVTSLMAASANVINAFAGRPQTIIRLLSPIATSIVFLFPIYFLWSRMQAGPSRRVLILALVCYWLSMVLAIPELLNQSFSSGIFHTFRSGIYLLGIALLGNAYIRDLIERLASETLQQRIWKERFEAFMDNSPFIAWVKNTAGEHEYFSKPYAMQIGIPIKNCEGKTDFDLWPKEVAESHSEKDQEVLSTGKSIAFESNHPLPSGSVKNWYVVKFPFRVGGNEDELFIGGIGLDVTEKRKAEEERDRFFETSSELMCISDANRCFKRANNAFNDILGYSQEELISQPFDDFVHPDDRQIMNLALKSSQVAKKSAQFESRMRCKDGTFRLISWTTPVAHNSETIFAVGRDVTEERAMEARLLKVVEDEQRRIAHDLHDGLGQELTGLAMMAESLALNLKDKNMQETQLANKIAVQLEASQQLTRILARDLRPIEVDSQGLQSALSQLADVTFERYGIACTFDCQGNVELANSETATQLYRIAQEAITNATRHANPKSIDVRLEENSGVLELKVIDDGIGIEDLNRSQDGIGIKSMKYRADVIGGMLRVESADGGGTIVACILPMY